MEQQFVINNGNIMKAFEQNPEPTCQDLAIGFNLNEKVFVDIYTNLNNVVSWENEYFIR